MSWTTGYNTPAKWPKVKLFQCKEKEVEANIYSPCVFTIRQTPNYVHHQFLFWDCKLTRSLNKKFLEHLRWKKHSGAVSTSPKNFVRKWDLVLGRLASKWVWANDGTLLSSLFLFIKKAYFFNEIWKNQFLNSSAVYCETNFWRV